MMRAVRVFAIALFFSSLFGNGFAQQERCADPSYDESDPRSPGHTLEPRQSQSDCDVDRVRNDEERRRMEQYIREFVRPDDIVKTLTLSPTEIVDCVDVMRQPSLRAPEMAGHVIQFEGPADPDRSESLATASEKETDPASLERLPVLRQKFADMGGCPARSVPIRRMTMDILKHFETLDDFFRKTPPHLADGPPDLHQHAVSRITTNNWGAQVILNVWSPFTERTDEFSLSQLWIHRGSGSNMETVEAGWQKIWDMYLDHQPRLFIYFTPDNYGSGGCYNLTCSGFVQVNNSIYIGGAFSSVSGPPLPSAAAEFKLRWQRNSTTGSWWLRYGETWVGYYPNRLFDVNGLRDRAAGADFGGEIIDREINGKHTATDMGSGHYPVDGFGYAAYQRQIRTISTSNAWGILPNLSASTPNFNCYDIAVSQSSGDWERYLFFGGPGYGPHCQ